jgi:hypothetical protein
MTTKVPMDVPEVASDMMRTFIYDEGFDSSLQQLDKAKEDNSCPLCPTCPERDSTTTLPSSEGAGSKKDPGMATFAISYAWLVAGGAAFAFLIVIAVIRRKRASPGSALQRASIVPQYELELRNGRFSDDPDDEYDEEEEQPRNS